MSRYWNALINATVRDASCKDEDECKRVISILYSGIRDGMMAYAKWEDGVQVVGSPEKPMKDELARIQEECQAVLKWYYPSATPMIFS